MSSGVKKFIPIKYIIGIIILFVILPIVFLIFLLATDFLKGDLKFVLIVTCAFLPLVGTFIFIPNNSTASMLVVDGKEIYNFIPNGTIDYFWHADITENTKVRIALKSEIYRLFKNKRTKVGLVFDFGDGIVRYVSCNLFSKNQIIKIKLEVENVVKRVVKGEFGAQKNENSALRDRGPRFFCPVVGYKSNSLKEYFYCPLCGNKLTVKQASEEIKRDVSPNADYYLKYNSFTLTPGRCEFIHDVLHCEKCGKSFDYAEQDSLETLQTLLKDKEKDLKAYTVGVKIELVSCTNGVVCDRLLSLSESSDVAVVIRKNNIEIGKMFLPVVRYPAFYRPKYVKYSKKKIINAINEILTGSKQTQNYEDYSAERKKARENKIKRGRALWSLTEIAYYGSWIGFVSTLIVGVVNAYVSTPYLSTIQFFILFGICMFSITVMTVLFFTRKKIKCRLLNSELG